MIPAAAMSRTSQFGSTHLSVVEGVYTEHGQDVAGREVSDLGAFAAQALA